MTWQQVITEQYELASQALTLKKKKKALLPKSSVQGRGSGAKVNTFRRNNADDFEMQYLLDIETLLLFLSSRKQSGEVSTDLKRFPGIAYKGPCHAYITLIEGKVISCIVQDQEGRILVDGESALQGLRGMGQLDWAWSTTSLKSVAAVPAQRKPPDMSSLIPRRIVPFERIDRNTLPRRHWQVLLLIDGSRTVARIATILSASPSPSDLQEVIRILQDLYQRGIIAAVDT